MQHPEQLPERAVSGASLTHLPTGSRPARAPIQGETVRLEPIDPDHHAADLYSATHSDAAGERVWDYLAYGPFANLADMHQWALRCATSEDPLFFAVRDLASGRAGGAVSFMNIHPANGSLEIGHIWLAPFLQNTRQGTEALFLLMRATLDTLGYRRLEWKCNALNQDSRRAAARLGFAFEGIFYQHMVVKGRNRDTAWFSLLDSEWPAVRANFLAWLSPENFDEHGTPRRSLSAMNRALRAGREESRE
jgi:RimJ/RimL family protein N-acetyltransferase